MLRFFFASAKTADEEKKPLEASPSLLEVEPSPDSTSRLQLADDASSSSPLSARDISLPQSPTNIIDAGTADQAVLSSTTSHPQPQNRRFAFHPFRPKVESKKHRAALSKDHEMDKESRAALAASKSLHTPVSSSSDKRAKQSALIVRSLIIGPSSISLNPSKPTRAVSKPELSKVKSQLMQTKSANKVIAQLRALPVEDIPVNGKENKGHEANYIPQGPIHAVCLEFTEPEADAKAFSHLTADGDTVPAASQSFNIPSVANAGVQALTALFHDIHLVSLITTPDLGLGQPGDGEGVLAGAIPTAETVIKGVQQITPQLMALGYATGRAVAPDHKGIYPPTDRMSVLTYWWGLEIALPPPTLDYLSNVQSVSTTVVNFLSALALVNNGVREILPFVRYISQYIDFEFTAIKGQNKGNGVVCAATWIMPAAMVPRPWDFPDPPSKPVAVKESVATPIANGSTLPEDDGSPISVVSEPMALPEVIITTPTPPSSTMTVSPVPA